MSKKGLHGARITESQFGFLLLLPALAVFIFIILYPFINSLIMSFTDLRLLSPERNFIGLDNFRNIFADPNFFSVLKNTVIFVVGGTFIPFCLGLIWAIVLNERFRGAEFLRGVTLVNWIIPSTAIGFIWMWVFQGNYGIVNGLLKKWGIISENINFLGSTEYAMLVVVIAKTWQTLPWFMAFLIGGLKSVPNDQIEAARIDGAGNINVFKHVIYPNMKTITILVLILGTIGSLQHFDLPWVMTQGGPARSTTTMSIEVYRSAFQEWNLSHAAAIGVVWVILLLLFCFFYIRNMRESIK